MPHDIRCPACRSEFRLPEWFDGRHVTCPNCAHDFRADFLEPMDVIPIAPPPASHVRPGLPSPPPRPPRRDYDDREPRRRERSDSLPAKRRRRRWPLVVGAGIVGGVILVFVLAVLSLSGKSRPVRAPVAEDPAVRRVDLTTAFRDGPADVDPVMNAQLTPLINVLGDGPPVFKRGEEFVDADACYAEVIARGLPGANRLQRFQTRSVAAESLAMNLGTANRAGYRRREVRLIRSISPDDAVILLRHWDDEGNALRERWWVTRRSGTWKVFDHENVDFAMRSSATYAALLTAAFGGDFAATDFITDVEAVNGFIHDGNLGEAERRLQRLSPRRYSGPIESYRIFHRGLLLSARDKDAEALAEFDKAAREQPASAAIDLHRGVALNQLGRHDEALRAISAFRDVLGDEHSVSVQMGNAFYGLNRREEACVAYRRALDFNPANASALGALIDMLPHADPRADLGPRFLKLSDPGKEYAALAEACIERRDGASLAALATALREIAPERADAAFHLARARLWQRRARPAVEALEAARKAESDNATRAEQEKEFFTDAALRPVRRDLRRGGRSRPRLPLARAGIA